MFDINIYDTYNEVYVSGFIFVYGETLKPSLYVTDYISQVGFDYSFSEKNGKHKCEIIIGGKSYKLKNKDFLVNKNGKWKVSKAEKERYQATFYLID